MDGSSGLPPAGAGSVGGVSKGLASPSSASSASAAAPSADKILREVMHKITQIVVRARIPAHADVRSTHDIQCAVAAPRARRPLPLCFALAVLCCARAEGWIAGS
jgi:hypothetical protein